MRDDDGAAVHASAALQRRNLDHRVGSERALPVLKVVPNFEQFDALANGLD